MENRREGHAFISPSTAHGALLSNLDLLSDRPWYAALGEPGREADTYLGVDETLRSGPTRGTDPGSRFPNRAVSSFSGRGFGRWAPIVCAPAANEPCSVGVSSSTSTTMFSAGPLPILMISGACRPRTTFLAASRLCGTSTVRRGKSLLWTQPPCETRVPDRHRDGREGRRQTEGLQNMVEVHR